MTGKILIFRRGSLGDGAVSIPALQWLAKTYPGTERRILTNTPVMEKAAGLEGLLGDINLVDGFLTYPPRLSGFSRIRALRKSIMTWAPNHVVYLSEPSGTLGLIREYLFFRCCGIRQFTGFPFNTQKRRFTQIGEDEWESEAGRLLRTVGGNSEDARIWRITFTDEERQLAAGQLTSWSSGTKDQQRFVAFSIGGKGADKDWGDPNWQSVLKEVSQANPNLGLIGIGAGNETERTDALLDHWSGPTLNLCGRTAPRISAQVMAPAEFYLGHDSGPMHLAALVGTRCLAVFSARAKPGVWFPQGEHNRIFYPWHESAAAPQEAGANRIAATIHTIKPESVIEACKEMLAENPVAG